MSKKNQKALKEEKDWERIGDAVFKSENFLARNQKQILIAIAAVVVIVCGYLAYQNFYVGPKTEEAQAAIFKGEYYYQDRQDSLALYGDGNGYIGFENIINEYGVTKVSDLAKAYAGLSYARMGKYEQALSYLKDYSGGDKLFTYIVKGTIGDCLANTGKVEESISYFMDAAKGLDDNTYSPMYYKKAGLAYRELKNYDKVIEVFTTVKNNYMSSMEGADAVKYIEEATLLKTSK